MDLAKAKNEEKLRLCRIYFLAGFAFLPFLWIVNFFWFFPWAFNRPEFNQQAAIRKYVIGSGVGAAIWVVIIVAWSVVFQMHRVEWGATGDYLSFVWPRGHA